MITPKILPARPSLESLHKQAKKLARETAAGKPAAVARARVQLPATTVRTASLHLRIRNSTLPLISHAIPDRSAGRLQRSNCKICIGPSSQR
jgi:hypothetical protein